VKHQLKPVAADVYKAALNGLYHGLISTMYRSSTTNWDRSSAHRRAHRAQGPKRPPVRVPLSEYGRDPQSAARLCVRTVTQGAMDKIDEAAAQLPPRLTPERAAKFVEDQLGFPVSPTTLKRAPIPRRRVGRQLIYESTHLAAYVRERLAAPPTLPVHHRKTESPALERRRVVVAGRDTRFKKKN
jgi:hypothetical protein